MIAWFTLTTLVAATAACPPKEMLVPCTCTGYQLVCSHIQNPNALRRPIAALGRLHQPTLIIRHSSLSYIPSGIFKGTKFTKITIDNSSLQSLSDTDTAFEGLEDTLQTLLLEKSRNASSWDLALLRNLRALRWLSFWFTDIGPLRYAFPSMKSLDKLDFDFAGLTTLHPTAFRNLTSVRWISLSGNKLKELDRHMFPASPNKLDTIFLSHNQISHLPHDFFTDMPLLEMLTLRGNQLQTLDQATFQPVFQNLKKLHMDENFNFTCDCRIVWILDNRIPESFSGECYHPEGLKGTPVKDLQTASFNC